jgi:HEAT repeat protein
LKEVLDYVGRIEGEEQLARYQRLLEVLHAPKSAVVDAAAAHLGSANAQEAQIARNLLKWAAPADPRGPADFTQFATYLRGHQAQLPPALVLWMYQRDPESAMEQMMALYGSRMASQDMHTMVIAARVLDQFEWKLRTNLASAGDTDALAVEQLEKLAGFSQWWVRLYVAEILAKYPQLRKPELVKQLAEDPDPLVRSVK